MSQSSTRSSPAPRCAATCSTAKSCLESGSGTRSPAARPAGLDPTHCGRGLATEAARAAIACAFDRLGFREVRAATDVPNAASIAVLERLGMEEWRRSEDGEHGTIFFRVSAPRE